MTAAPATIEVDDLSRRFGRAWVLARVDLHVPAGARVRITGANGSGKTTLLRCLATALKPHAGQIRIDGRDTWADRAAARAELAFYSHAPRLYEDLSGLENLAVWHRLLDPARRRVPASELPGLLERVGLPPRRTSNVRTYSAGMRRRLALARVLATQPRLLLLDEPFSALDPDGRALVIDIVREVCERGCTLVAATHLPEVAAELCDHAVHMEAGRVVTSTLPPLPGGPS